MATTLGGQENEPQRIASMPMMIGSTIFAITHTLQATHNAWEGHHGAQPIKRLSTGILAQTPSEKVSNVDIIQGYEENLRE